MSEQGSGESPEETRDHVEEFSVSVEQQDGGWAVVREADGERSVIETHAEEEDARRQAEMLAGAADRFTGAARQDAVPDSYPGKGVDETRNTPPESSGA